MARACSCADEDEDDEDEDGEDARGVCCKLGCLPRPASPWETHVLGDLSLMHHEAISHLCK